MSGITPEFSAEEFSDLAKGKWNMDVLSDMGRHVSFEQPDFPAQVDVMFERHSSEWQVSLFVWNDQRGFMDLLSADYAKSFEPDDESGVRECISDFMNEIESGELDRYRSEASTMR